MAVHGFLILELVSPLVRRCHRVAVAYSELLDTDEVGMVPDAVIVPNLITRMRFLTAPLRNSAVLRDSAVYLVLRFSYRRDAEDR